MMGVATNGVRVGRAEELLQTFPLPPSATSTGDVWQADVMTLPSARVTLFAPRGAGVQGSHDQDELYLVFAGSAVLVADGESHDVRAGIAAWVPAGTVHRFVNVSRDFATWTVWLPTPEPDVRRVAADFTDAWMRGDLDTVVGMLTEDCMLSDSYGQDWYGPQSARAIWALWSKQRAAAGRLEISDPTVFNDRAMVEWTVFDAAGVMIGHGVELLTLRGWCISRRDGYQKRLADTPPDSPPPRAEPAGDQGP